MKKDLEMLTETGYDLEYNGSTAKSYGVFLYDYPEFSGAEKNYNVSSVAGRLGEIAGIDDYRTNQQISCTLSILNEGFMQNVRELKRWLSGNGKLSFSENPEIFYKVQKIEYGDIARELKNYGQFTVVFQCIPYEFLKSGQIETDKNGAKQNAYSMSRPIFKIVGEGMCTLTVNGKTMKANVGQNLTIDTELMLAYREDGELQNTAVSGNYEDLYLLSGTNSISITNGFQLKIIPQWGYEV